MYVKYNDLINCILFNTKNLEVYYVFLFILVFQYEIIFKVRTKCPEINYVILRDNLCFMKRCFVLHFK